MFPLLHDRTRRLLCRTLFLLLGLLPTGAVLAWSTVINGEAYRAATCEQLAATLGCNVRLTAVSHPRPEITLLEGFELVDPETDEVLLHSPRVEIHHNEQSQSIEATQPEIKLAGRNWLLPILERRLRLSVKQQPPLQLHAAEATLAWSEGKQGLRDCEVDFKSFDEGNAALATFPLADKPSTEPIWLQIQRTSKSGQPISSFELKTGPTPLPCSLLAAVMERDNPFGTGSTFRGTLQANDGSNGWYAQVSEGLIEQVDLNALVRQHFPGQCSGAAEIQLQHAIFHRGRAEELEGAMKSGSGVVNRAVLQAAANSLQLPCRPSSWPADVPFVQLAAEFKLTSAGLMIRGKCDRFQGIVLRSLDEPILWQPSVPLPPWWRW